MRTRAAGKRRGSPRAAAPIDPKSWDSILAAFVDHLERQRYSVSFKNQVRRSLPRFFAYLSDIGIKDIRNAADEHVVAFAHRLTRQIGADGKTFSGATVRTYLGQLQRFCAFLEQRGVIFRSPAVDLVLPTQQKLPRAVLTQAQAEKLMTAADATTTYGKRNRAILETLYGTGLRASECRALELRDLDLAKGTLVVRAGKGRKDRMVPIAGRAAEAIDVYLRDARRRLVRSHRVQALFVSDRGRVVSLDLISLIVVNAAKAAGLPLRVSPHVLRHSCATHLLQRGADVRQVQKILGHSSIKTTTIYTRVAMTDLRRVIDKSHPRERSWRRRRTGRRR